MEHAEPVSTTAGILSREAGKQQKDIKARLGPKVSEVSSTTGSPTASGNKQGELEVFTLSIQTDRSE